jgi:Ser/Thr protein kinase RdoA (MazF antagonist)
VSRPLDLSTRYALAFHGEGQPVTGRVTRWRSDTGDVAVKAFAAGDRVRGEWEAGVLAFLGNGAARPDVHVQTPVPTRDGAPWADDGAGGCVLVTRWVTGHYRAYDTYAAQEWAALGRALGSLHACLDAMPGEAPETLSARLGRIDPDRERARLAIAGRPLPSHPWIDAAWLAHYLALCRAMLLACHAGALDAFPTDDPQRPIHNDYNQFNYLFGDTLPPTIIDWEASIGAPREFEVVRCLNHLPLQSPALARAFVHGYLERRVLRAGLMPWAVDVACLMHATKHWVLQGWLDGRPGFDRRLLGAMDMVSLLARERARLAGFFVDTIEEACT